MSKPVVRHVSVQRSRICKHRPLDLVALVALIVPAVLVAATSALLLGGCGAAPPDDRDLCATWLPGDLVITEVLVDPEGADTGREYIELFNPGDRTVELGGLTLYTIASSEKKVTIGDAQVLPGAYFVLADAGIQPPRSGVDYTWGDGFGALMNARGVIGIRCGAAVIDEVSYGRTQPGRARELDGALPPDAIANDDESAWCDAETAIASSEDFGTPGGPNQACGGGPLRVCEDPVTGMSRPAQAPGPGDLIITEALPRPAASPAADGEWFELYATRELDLNGLSVRTGSAGVLASALCLHVPKGGYAVIGRRQGASDNGGLRGILSTVAVRLADSGGTLGIYDGVTLIDEIRWASSEAGVALQLDSGRLSAGDNDDPQSFCPAVDVYGAGDRGTPGAANRSCSRAATVDECVDGQTGSPRPQVKPAPGDLRISEVMADPAAVPDVNGEWIELAASASVDLNGLVVAVGASRETISAPGCLRVEPGQHALLARSSAAATNGGLPAVIGTFGLALPNGGGTVTLESDLGIIDSLSWSLATAGVALQRDPADLASLCDATAAYGTTAADRGTPGSANSACAADQAPPPPAAEGMCFDASLGASRAIAAPSSGDLIVSEIMADPAAVTDAAGEWFEVFVARNVDLNGLVIGTESGSMTAVTSTECAAATAGTFLVFARGLDPAENGGLPSVAARFGFALPNSGSAEAPRTVLLRHGDREIDRATYVSTQPGVSLQRSADTMGGSCDGLAATWCSSPSTDPAGQPIHRFGAGDVGTPGAANVICP